MGERPQAARPPGLWWPLLIAACALTPRISAADGDRPQLPAGLTSQSPVTVERGGRPIAEVLSALGDQTGVDMRASPDLAEQKLTVRFKETPLRDAAEAVAAAVDGVWEEAAQSDAHHRRYVLEASKRRAARLARYRRARKAAEAARDRAALAELRKALDDAARAPAPAAEPGQGGDELRWRPRLLMQVLRGLPDAALRQWILDSSASFLTPVGSVPDSTPQLIIPTGSLSASQRDALVQFLRAVSKVADTRYAEGYSERFATFAEGPDAVRLELWANTEQMPAGQLVVDAWASLTAPGITGWRFDCQVLAMAGAPFTDDLESIEQLASPGSERDSPVESERKVDIIYGSARLDRALLEVARAADLNVAAEYFTKPGHLDLVTHQAPLGGVVKRAEKLYKLAHFWVGSTLVLRARDWTYACDREPWAAITDQWDEAERVRGALSLADYLAAATLLDDAQIATMANHADEHGRLQYYIPIQKLARKRHFLRAYATLSGQQIQQLESPDGLSLASLSGSQAERWARAVRPLVLVLAGADPRSVSFHATLAQSAEQAIPEFIIQVPGAGSGAPPDRVGLP